MSALSPNAVGGPAFYTALGPSRTPGGFSGRSFGTPGLVQGFGFPSFGDPLFYFQPAASSFFINRLLGYANGSAVNINVGPTPANLGFGGLLLGMGYYADSGNPGEDPFADIGTPIQQPGPAIGGYPPVRGGGDFYGGGFANAYAGPRPGGDFYGGGFGNAYGPGRPPQGFPPQGFPPQGFPPQGFPPQALGIPAPGGFGGPRPGGFPPQFAYGAPQGFPPQGFPPQGYGIPQQPRGFFG
jgi:hypothetical protein